MNMYSDIVKSCFDACINDFTSSSVSESEVITCMINE